MSLARTWRAAGAVPRAARLLTTDTPAAPPPSPTPAKTSSSLLAALTKNKKMALDTTPKGEQSILQALKGPQEAASPPQPIVPLPEDVSFAVTGTRLGIFDPAKVEKARAALPQTEAAPTPTASSSAAAPAAAPTAKKSPYHTREELQMMIKAHTDFSDLIAKYTAAADEGVKSFAQIVAAALGKNPHLSAEVKRNHFESLLKKATFKSSSS